MMIIFVPGKTTGKQAYRTIMDAVKARGKALDVQVTKMDFLRESSLSRATLHLFQKGAKPSAESLIKIARGLTSWGFDVRIEFDKNG